MRRLLMVTAVLAVSSSLAGAATVTCDAPPNPGVPVNVIGLTILCGGLTFDSFSVVDAGGAPSPVVDLVSATFTGGVAELAFNPNLSVASGSVADLHFFFTVTGGIDQIDLGVGPSRSSITEVVCDAPLPGGVCSGNTLTDVTVRSITPSQPIWSSAFANTSPVYIFKDISVDGRESAIFGAAGDGGLSSFTQSFHTVVPEPASLGLLGSALVGLAALARRKIARG